ncbi:hypothetical protein [Alicyclobacillus sacchari]|uniref:hypothetical protein n=1 Tax=Alicyclobacillus sacchari TaxID=392010 RepID=UPI0024E07BF9|nr:hypothetical protein [Alicyclobacillus sacchari]
MSHRFENLRLRLGGSLMLIAVHGEHPVLRLVGLPLPDNFQAARLQRRLYDPFAK